MLLLRWTQICPTVLLIAASREQKRALYHDLTRFDNIKCYGIPFSVMRCNLMLHEIWQSKWLVIYVIEHSNAIWLNIEHSEKRGEHRKEENLRWEKKWHAPTTPLPPLLFSSLLFSSLLFSSLLFSLQPHIHTPIPTHVRTYLLILKWPVFSEQHLRTWESPLLVVPLPKGTRLDGE